MLLGLFAVLISQIDWIELGKTLGVPAAILFFIFSLVAIYFKTMLPFWKDNVQADVELKRALTVQLPVIAESTKQTLEEIRKMRSSR